MEIQASSKFDYESMKALTHVTFYGKRNPKNIFIIISVFVGIIPLLPAVLAFLCVGYFSLDLMAYMYTDSDFLFEIVFVAVLLELFNCFMYFWAPKIQFRNLKKMQNIQNDFIFYDDYIKVTSVNAEYNGEGEIQYSLLLKVMETSKYLFVYPAAGQAYIIDKSTITNGTLEELQDKFKQLLNKKYIVCKY